MADSDDGDASSGPDFVASLPLIDALESAIGAAVAAEDWFLAAHLAFQLSRLLHRFHWMQYAIAFDDLALDALDALPSDMLPSLRELRLTLLRQSGLDHLLLGNLNLAAKRFAAAQELLNDSIEPRLRADLYWDASVLAQWRDDPALGLKLAQQAWEFYESNGPLLERQRLRLHIAQLAMDVVAASMPQDGSSFSPESSQLLDLAKAHISEARPDSTSRHATEVEIIFLLAYVRFSRITDCPEDRLSLLEYAERRASLLNSASARGQVLAALGDEHLALGNVEMARTYYQQAVDILSSSLAPGLALRPLRALERL